MSERRRTGVTIQGRRGGVFNATDLRREGLAAMEKTTSVLAGVSLLTRSESLGWGRWNDAFFLAQVAAAAQAAEPTGLKARFAHPGLSADGIGTFLGRFHNVRIEGDNVVGDLHFAESARSGPDGDLVEYVTRLVSEDPRACGTSIVFMPDGVAMDAFGEAHGATWKSTEFGTYLDYSTFKSPDPANAKNLPHDRLSSLHACDVVDEPAANPGGVFAPVEQLGAQFEAVALVGLGLSDAPVSLGRGLTARGIRAWAKDFLAKHHLSISKGGKPMQDDPNKEELAEAPEGETPVEEPTEPEAIDPESPNYMAGYEAGYAAAQTAAESATTAPPVDENASMAAARSRIAQLRALTGATSDFVLKAFEQNLSELDAAKLLLQQRAAAPAVPVPAALAALGVGGVPPVAVDQRTAGSAGQPTTFAEAVKLVEEEARAANRSLKPGVAENEVRLRWPQLYVAASNKA